MPKKTESKSKGKSSARLRADQIKDYRCKNLIAVIEEPKDIKNIGTIIRNVNALGVDKTYIVDRRAALPDDWHEMREGGSLSKVSVSAIKWSFVKRFNSTEECINHLEKNRFVSIVTSPHIKGKHNATLDDVDFAVHAKLAVWFGSESRGISDLAVQHAEMCVSIPMFGMIESLNLGTTSGIVLYEVTKQRRATLKSIGSGIDASRYRQKPVVRVRIVEASQAPSNTYEASRCHGAATDRMCALDGALRFLRT